MSLKVELLRKHIRDWKARLAEDSQRAEHDKQERANRVAYYRAHVAAPSSVCAISAEMICRVTTIRSQETGIALYAIPRKK